MSRLALAGRGVLLGQRTLGAGCGYTNSGLDVGLARSQLRVRLPNCVRYLPSGDNEVAGIAPDISLAAADATTPAFLAEALAGRRPLVRAGRASAAALIPPAPRAPMRLACSRCNDDSGAATRGG